MIRTDRDEQLWNQLPDWERERTFQNAQYVLDEYGPNLTLVEIQGILLAGG